MILKLKPFLLPWLAVLWIAACLGGCAPRTAPPPTDSAALPPARPTQPGEGSVARQSIPWLDSLEKAEEQAKKEKKPLLIDFWGPG